MHHGHQPEAREISGLSRDYLQEPSVQAADPQGRNCNFHLTLMPWEVGRFSEPSRSRARDTNSSHSKQVSCTNAGCLFDCGAAASFKTLNTRCSIGEDVTKSA